MLSCIYIFAAEKHLTIFQTLVNQIFPLCLWLYLQTSSTAVYQLKPELELHVCRLFFLLISVCCCLVFPLWMLWEGWIWAFIQIGIVQVPCATSVKEPGRASSASSCGMDGSLPSCSLAEAGLQSCIWKGRHQHPHSHYLLIVCLWNTMCYPEELLG